MAAIQFVVFALGEEEYGINVSAVNGILRAKKFKIQSLSGMPEEIEGMINLRGKANYIYNLRKKFNFSDTNILEEGKFILLNEHNFSIGCAVDEVTDIIKYNEEDLQQVPSFIQDVNKNYYQGIAQINESMIIIIDPVKLLFNEEDKSVTELA